MSNSYIPGDRQDIDDIITGDVVSECCSSEVKGGHCSLCGEPCEGISEDEIEHAYMAWENSHDYQVEDYGVQV